jgi:phosphatidylinositol alpha 1,6-mannosyltransferase
MRIALFAETSLSKIDGITNTVCYLLEHLALRGHDCFVFAPEGGPPSYAFPLYPGLRLVAPALNVERDTAPRVPKQATLAAGKGANQGVPRHARFLARPAPMAGQCRRAQARRAL